MAGTASADAIWKDMQDDGIEFFLAQFVEMHGKPNAKLMPVASSTTCSRRVPVRGLRRRPDRADAGAPDMLAVPDTSSYTRVPWQPDFARFACDVTVEGEPGRTARAPFCAACSRAQRASASRWASRPSSSSCARATTARRRRSARYERAALLRRRRYRNYEFLTTLSRYATSSATATTRTTTRTRTASSSPTSPTTTRYVTCDRAIFFRYMVHVAQQRGKLATFMPKPFGHLTGNGCHFHLSLWDKAGRRTSSRTPRTPTATGCRTPPTTSSPASPPRDAVSAIVAPTVNSYKRIGVGAPDGRDVVAGLRRLGRQQPHPDDPGAGRPADRAPRDRRRGQSVPRGHRRARRRPRRHRAQARSGPAEHGQPVRVLVRRAHGAAGSSRCRRTCSRRSASSRRDDVLRAALGRGRDEDYVDYYARVKRDEWFRYHEQAAPSGDPRVPDPVLTHACLGYM